MERARVARHHAAAERAAQAAAAAKAEAEARAKAELDESTRRLAAVKEDRDAARAAVKIQCAARRRHARGEKMARQLLEEQRHQQRRQEAAAAKAEAAAAKAEAAAAKAEAEARAKAELHESQLAAVTEERDAARAAVKIQCAARRRHARGERMARQLLEEQQQQQQQQQQEGEEREHEEQKEKELEQEQKQEQGRRGEEQELEHELQHERKQEQQGEERELEERKTQAADDQAATGNINRGRAGWRKKSVVGARGAAGVAGLQVQVPRATER